MLHSSLSSGPRKSIQMLPVSSVQLLSNGISLLKATKGQG